MEIIYIHKNIPKKFSYLEYGEWLDNTDLEEDLKYYVEQIDNYSKNSIKLIFSEPRRDGSCDYYVFTDGMYKGFYFYEEVGYGYIKWVEEDEMKRRIGKEVC